MATFKKILCAVCVWFLVFVCGEGVSDSSAPENECVILIHGFNKTASDMSSLDTFLRASGYHTECPALPTTFSTVEDCTTLFEREFPKIAENYDRIHLVGHSMGGLIIRTFLSRNHVPNLGRCVLIASPNQGTDLAYIVARYFKFSLLLFRSIEDFQPGGLPIPSPMQAPSPEIGVIAGSDSNLLLGKLIDGENDGRVPVDGVSFPGMKDFAVTPYDHHNIHHTTEVAILVRDFIRNGTFDANGANER
ncbi:alpha/beta fold hydrolase [Candidatus Latescibacterota bacterium]